MADSTNARVIEGWVVKYGLPSIPLVLSGGRRVFEIIQQDAFAESIAAINSGVEPAIECNVEHAKKDALMRLGTSDVNVKVENRSEGVYAVVSLINDSISADIFDRIKAGFVRGLSVEFDPRPVDSEAAYEITSGGYVRKWSRLTLKGFAVVAEGFYPDAKIVKASEGGAAVFARSLKQADIDRVSRDIEHMEMERQRLHYKYESFLLGIR